MTKTFDRQTGARIIDTSRDCSLNYPLPDWILEKKIEQLRRENHQISELVKFEQRVSP